MLLGAYNFFGLFTFFYAAAFTVFDRWSRQAGYDFVTDLIVVLDAGTDSSATGVGNFLNLHG